MFCPQRWRQKRVFFCTLRVDGYHVIKQHFLQDQHTPLSNHIVLLFFVIFRASRCVASHPQHIRNSEIVAKKRSVTSLFECLSCKKKNAACISKGKECHKTVLNIQEVYFKQERVQWRTSVGDCHDILSAYTSPHRPLTSDMNWQSRALFHAQSTLCSVV